MAENPCAGDIGKILSHRGDNGGDLWATLDGRLMKGSPFTTLDCACMLPELGMDPEEPVLKATAALIFGAQRERTGGSGYRRMARSTPATRSTAAHCAVPPWVRPPIPDSRRHSIICSRRSKATAAGKCNKYSFGRGPETEFSNPGPTLAALDAFRFTPYLNRSAALDRAAEFLLAHWTTRTPLGPCHYGIGTLFMQVTYPFSAYNLFFYVYALSFYDRAKGDPRFREAFEALKGKLRDGQIVVERPNPKLVGFRMLQKGPAKHSRHQAVPGRS